MRLKLIVRILFLFQDLVGGAPIKKQQLDVDLPRSFSKSLPTSSVYDKFLVEDYEHGESSCK